MFNFPGSSDAYIQGGPASTSRLNALIGTLIIRWGQYDETFNSALGRLIAITGDNSLPNWSFSAHKRRRKLFLKLLREIEPDETPAREHIAKVIEFSTTIATTRNDLAHGKLGFNPMNETLLIITKRRQYTIGKSELIDLCKRVGYLNVLINLTFDNDTWGLSLDDRVWIVDNFHPRLTLATPPEQHDKVREWFLGADQSLGGFQCQPIMF